MRSVESNSSKEALVLSQTESRLASQHMGCWSSSCTKWSTHTIKWHFRTVWPSMCVRSRTTTKKKKKGFNDQCSFSSVQSCKQVNGHSIPAIKHPKRHCVRLYSTQENKKKQDVGWSSNLRPTFLWSQPNLKSVTNWFEMRSVLADSPCQVHANTDWS